MWHPAPVLRFPRENKTQSSLARPHFQYYHPSSHRGVRKRAALTLLIPTWHWHELWRKERNRNICVSFTSRTNSLILYKGFFYRVPSVATALMTDSCCKCCFPRWWFEMWVPPAAALVNGLFTFRGTTLNTVMDLMQTVREDGGDGDVLTHVSQDVSTRNRTSCVRAVVSSYFELSCQMLFSFYVSTLLRWTSRHKNIKTWSNKTRIHMFGPKHKIQVHQRQPPVVSTDLRILKNWPVEFQRFQQHHTQRLHFQARVCMYVWFCTCSCFLFIWCFGLTLRY